MRTDSDIGARDVCQTRPTTRRTGGKREEFIMTTNRETMVAEITGWTNYRLANEAECGTPDSVDSVGARMLDSVRINVLALMDDMDTQQLSDINDDGGIDEIADGAPSVYTHERFQQFVDLAAYHEDISELGMEGSDMEAQAGSALYMIAERLANVIVDRVREASEQDDATDAS